MGFLFGRELVGMEVVLASTWQFAWPHCAGFNQPCLAPLCPSPLYWFIQALEKQSVLTTDGETKAQRRKELVLAHSTGLECSPSN